ncbi:hypothetical protein [Pseudonocardia charpentierae]|uniref:Phospholipase A2 n=1 Tax=Pseudonocardia charpentierae TaxID=3075545 RepID=A0ABU2NLN2_9PSEU|nr:hypothetical protein [Pseudonocardia sp. DSM 45834]MDT0353948.1 hypothetical protein [Pseudonocardia sp. DSM 45834]
MSTDTVTVPTSAVHARTFGGLRRVLTTAGIAGALLAGGIALPATASAAEMPASHNPSLVLAARCPFGTHGGPGGGCRGGSINDNARVNRAASDTADMYRDAGECAVKAVGKSVWRNRKKPTLPTVALGTIKPGIKCGRSKGY